MNIAKIPEPRHTAPARGDSAIADWHRAFFGTALSVSGSCPIHLDPAFLTDVIRNLFNSEHYKCVMDLESQAVSAAIFVATFVASFKYAYRRFPQNFPVTSVSRLAQAG